MISRTSTPARAGRSSRPSLSGNFLSREQDEDVLEVRRAPLALVAVRVEDADGGAGAAGALAVGVRVAFDLLQLRRWAVDLDRLAAGVLGDQRLRRSTGDGLAVRHDRHGVR